VALEVALNAHADDAQIERVKHAAQRARGVAIDTQVLGESGVHCSAYYRRFMQPIGGRHSLLALLTLRGRPLGMLMLGRTGAEFRTDDVARIAQALPALAVARATFHVPVVLPPLPRAPEASTHWRSRLSALFDSSRILASSGDDTTRKLLVRDHAGYREMVAVHDGREFVWSRAHLGTPWRSGWFYVELVQLAAARAEHHQRALFLGCGGAVAIRQFRRLYPQMAIDIVEADPLVLEWANRWYGLDAISGVTTTCTDASSFVSAAPSARWDVVVVDAYDDSCLASELLDTSFMVELARVLRSAGALAFNVLGALSGMGPVQQVERAARKALHDVRLIPVLDPEESFSPHASRNVVVLGSKRCA
jgi:spermidine synthase